LTRKAKKDLDGCMTPRTTLMLLIKIWLPNNEYVDRHGMDEQKRKFDVGTTKINTKSRLKEAGRCR
jgi:hypothetical protein